MMRINDLNGTDGDTEKFGMKLKNLRMELKKSFRSAFTTVATRPDIFLGGCTVTCCTISHAKCTWGLYR